VTSPPLSWVIGGGGLLGRHVDEALNGRRDGPRRFDAGPIGWGDDNGASGALEREAVRFLDRAARSGEPWRLMWCAGAGVVSTSPEALAQETRLIRRFLEGLTGRLSREPGLARAGSVLFASSAGGVYSASRAAPPFHEHSPTGCLAPYGREKLAQEDLFGSFALDCSVDLLVGRFSNLYGPGQSLSKAQGLISHVGRAALMREPVSLYVPLDTIRDYLFAADAGRMVRDAVERLEQDRREGAGHRVVTKIFASEIETTVASVLGAWRQSLRRPLRVALASNPAGRLQPRILSFRSRVWPEVRGRPTMLPLGVEAVRRDQLARLMAAGLN
jgi:UDP-glucose 4-epimerase